jgi:hypothetical protein
MYHYLLSSHLSTYSSLLVQPIYRVHVVYIREGVTHWQVLVLQIEIFSYVSESQIRTDVTIFVNNSHYLPLALPYPHNTLYIFIFPNIYTLIR